MRKIINFNIILGILFIFSQSCSEMLRHDEYHKLSSEQHFSLTHDSMTIITNNNEHDTILFIGLIKAQFEKELYTGIHCKGPYDYIEFERIYYALKQDISLIENKNGIQSPSNFYGYCHINIPQPEECIQFSFGYPKNEGQIKNAPVLTLNNRNYFCTILLDTVLIDKEEFIDTFKYQLDSVEFRKFGFIKNIYMTRQVGIVRIETANNDNWNKTN